MEWVNCSDPDFPEIGANLPEPGRPVVLQSKHGKFFVGQRAEHGDTFRIVSKCELMDSGDIQQLTTGSLDPMYFIKWAYLDE